MIQDRYKTINGRMVHWTHYNATPNLHVSVYLYLCVVVNDNYRVMGIGSATTQEMAYDKLKQSINRKKM